VSCVFDSGAEEPTRENQNLIQTNLKKELDFSRFVAKSNVHLFYAMLTPLRGASRFAVSYAGFVRGASFSLLSRFHFVGA